MIRSARAREVGAESLEFLGVLPLLILVGLLLAQLVLLVRQQAEADADARTLARSAVICSAPPLSLAAVDPAAHGEFHIKHLPDSLMAASVALQPQLLWSGFDLSSLPLSRPHATVVMRHEPC